MPKKVSGFVVVFVTTPRAQAKKIANKIITTRAAACVNIIPAIQSLYWWKGKVETGAEALLVIKTRKNLFKKLESVIRQVHSYTVPEIIALPIAQGHQPYLRWIQSETRA